MSTFSRRFNPFSSTLFSSRFLLRFAREKKSLRCFSSYKPQRTPYKDEVSGPQGLLTIQQLENHVAQGEIDTVIVGFTDHIGRYFGKRLDAEYFLKSAKQGIHTCNYLFAIDIELNILEGFKNLNWETGFGDFELRPDYNTLRACTWLDRTAQVLCDVLNDKHDLLSFSPRSMLIRQLQNLEREKISASGATELEYFLYQNSYQGAIEDGYRNLKPFGWIPGDYSILQGTREEFFHSKARRHLKASGLPVEGSKGEYGIGQHELNISHSGLLENADRHIVYKQCLKEIAEGMGVSVTFMAKPSADQPGSSCHLHLSLQDSKGKNLFSGDETIGSVKGCSSTFRHFLGGWIKYTPEIMPFFAPNVNSYKRFRASSWAPTVLGWSMDNRTAPFRIVGKDENFRIECRLPGADCNPYLAFAASLACGLEGIAQKIDPPKQLSGNFYQLSDQPRVPNSLESAVKLFEKSDFAKKAFGEDVVEHYSNFFNKEVDSFLSAVTDWERKRYFEHT
eukprot:TRINITY_DN8380_c0_g1_i1.p1 TRINITY_DN8380_c0_g1~~TRINITY_DN8380_c0_g1_i1.p1  ORF type:complete len:532 (-),score=81.14 TRINITY_DN8380_c0_g1_i1:88-1608(-)